MLEDFKSLNPSKNEEDYTPRQKEFLSLLFTEAEGDIRTAMTMAGYSKNTALSEVTGPLHEEIVKLTKEFMAVSTARAAFALQDVMNRPATPGAKTRLDAANSVLDRGGVSKSQDVKVESQVQNIFILPEKKKEDKIIDVEYDEIEPDFG